MSWVKTPGNQAAPDRDRALFLLADAYFRDYDLVTSFYQYDELLDNYPESRFYNPSLERQFAIADKYPQRSQGQVPLFFRILSQEDKAIDMLFRIREYLRLAAGRTCVDADGGVLLRHGGVRLRRRRLRRLRPRTRSPELGTVRLRQAFSSFAQFRGIKFDSTPLIDARSQFQDLQVRYPEIAKQAETTKFVDTINHTLAKKMLDMSDYYRRTSRPKAAAYTLLHADRDIPQYQ